MPPILLPAPARGERARGEVRRASFFGSSADVVGKHVRQEEFARRRYHAFWQDEEFGRGIWWRVPKVPAQRRKSLVAPVAMRMTRRWPDSEHRMARSLRVPYGYRGDLRAALCPAVLADRMVD
jgi:hypothetical protein